MGEYAFMSILLNLIHHLSDIDTASLQLNVNDRHTVDEQHHITTSSCAKRMFCLESWLTDCLINTLSCTYLTSIENGKINFLAIVYLIVRIVSLICC